MDFFTFTVGSPIWSDNDPVEDFMPVTIIGRFHNDLTKTNVLCQGQDQISVFSIQGITDKHKPAMFYTKSICFITITGAGVGVGGLVGVALR